MMKKLNLNRLRVTAATTGGRFGAEFVFEPGLNIIRAENTSGKSTLTNMLLYGLGLEMLMGRVGEQVIKPALKSELDFEGKTHKVLESFVDLEIQNAQGKPISIRRQIVGSEKTPLMRVIEGAMLSSQFDRSLEEKYYYVGVPGAAQGKQGFHRYLADYIGWDLPSVPTYSGKDVPLYMECIMPLLFIEQIKGWSGIQATTPTKYGIQNVTKATIEFLLNLDVSDIQSRKRELASRRTELKAQWSNLRSNYEMLAQSVNGRVSYLPLNPIVVIDDRVLPTLVFEQNGVSVHLDAWVIQARENLINLEHSIALAPAEADPMRELAVKQAEEQLLIAQSSLQDARMEHHFEKNNIIALQERIQSLENDLVKNQEALRLQRYGAKVASSIAKGSCPTCHQGISDSLLDQSVFRQIMPLETNVAFIKQQLDVARALLESTGANLTKKLAIVQQQSETVEHIRRKIRDIRNSLTSSSRLPDQAQIREKIREEEKLERLEKVREEWFNLTEKLLNFSVQWESLLTQEKQIPDEPFSIVDKAKLHRLEALLKLYLNQFGFRSTSEEVQISRDTYRPTSDGLKDISFEASASDNIRLIWAYTLAMQRLAEDFVTNHLGFTVFDEPGQQQIDQNSSAAFYGVIHEMDEEKNQVVVATSAEMSELRVLLNGRPANLRDYGTKVLKPCDW